MAELRTPQGHTLLLPEGSLSIGADPANDVPVAAQLGLAPVHFRLQPWEGGHFLEDAGSGLGTLVNGHSVNWKPLTDGDIITAGELEVVYGQKSEAGTRPVPVIVAPSAQPLLTGLVPPLLPVVSPLPSTTSAGCASEVVPSAVSFSGGRITAPASGSLTLPMVPPAWLPEDLLPDSYRLPPVPSTSSPPEKSGGSLPGHLPSPATPPAARRDSRRVLPLAAICVMLAWAGHAAWQRGYLAPIFQLLHPSQTTGLPGPALREDEGHMPAPAGSGPAVPIRTMSFPAEPSHAASPRPTPSMAVPAPTSEIATQNKN